MLNADFLLVRLVFGLEGRLIEMEGEQVIRQCKADSRDFRTRRLAGGESNCSTKIQKNTGIHARGEYGIRCYSKQVVVKGYTLYQ